MTPIDEIQTSDPVSALRLTINEMLPIVNAAATWSTGPLGSRPVANSVPAGTFYFTSDTSKLYQSDGTDWTLISDPYFTGTFAARPAANSVPTGSIHRSTDTGEVAISDAADWYVVSDAAKLGLTDAGGVRRGKSIISGAETRSNTAYGLLATPDRVQNIVLPTDGLIFIMYQAMWEESVSGASQAAIFLGSNQLKVQHDETTGGANGEQSALNGSTAASDQVLATAPGIGLVGSKLGAFNRPANWTTGQVAGLTSRVADGIVYRAGSTDNRQIVGPVGVGGPLAIFAAAGTYDVSVQFKASSGSVTASDRRLWVWTQGF